MNIKRKKKKRKEKRDEEREERMSNINEIGKVSVACVVQQHTHSLSLVEKTFLISSLLR